MTTMTLHEPRTLRTSTEGLGPRPADPIDYRAMSDPLADVEVDDLCRHVVVCHHRYARETAPLIEGWLDVLVVRHAPRHPELLAVRTAFSQLSRELLAAITREERVVFPAIHRLATAVRHHDDPGPASLAMGDTIGLAARQDTVIEALMTQIRMLTKRYHVPEDGCLTYRLCYEELHRFDTDLARHVYLEMRILYPRALELGWLTA